MYPEFSGAWHMGRSFDGPRHLELDPECFCEKAPCGLIVVNKMGNDDARCPNHSMTKTIRTAHRAEKCEEQSSWMKK